MLLRAPPVGGYPTVFGILIIEGSPQINRLRMSCPGCDPRAEPIRLVGWLWIRTRLPVRRKADGCLSCPHTLARSQTVHFSRMITRYLPKSSRIRPIPGWPSTQRAAQAKGGTIGQHLRRSSRLKYSCRHFRSKSFSTNHLRFLHSELTGRFGSGLWPFGLRRPRRRPPAKSLYCLVGHRNRRILRRRGLF